VAVGANVLAVAPNVLAVAASALAVAGVDDEMSQLKWLLSICGRQGKSS
jgi:hypothetical protein